MSLPQLKFTQNFAQEQLVSEVDGVIYIVETLDHLYSTSSLLKDASGIEAFKSIAQVDEVFGSEPTLVHNAQVPGSRAIVALTGSLNYDTDDVRAFYEVALKATQRALKAGIRNPAFVIKSAPQEAELYKRQVEVALLGALEADYEGLISREHFQALNVTKPHLNSIHLVSSEIQEQSAQTTFELVKAIESGKRLSKDLGGSNQERMTPLRFAEYVENAFAGTNVEVQVIREVSTIEKEYPLLGAVARSSKEVPKHHPTVIKLNYRSPKPEDVKENLFFVGKGVCFDTGGADLKVGGVMRGMSSDKCGAASVAGFLLAVAHLKPTNLNITASCAMVINSIGPNAYLCDEIITSRAGKRVLVANTDAEGRMAMTDLLAEAKELALVQKAKNPEQPVQLFTVATLTGHAVLAVGPYSIALDNGPARKRKISQRIFDAGLEWGDIFEVSTLRREDFQVIAPGSDAEDVVQSGTAPSSRTTRGHQFPAAFMITASGLDKHGLNASQNEQVPYTHLDIAGGSTDHARGWGIERANGRPLASLLGAFVL